MQKVSGGQTCWEACACCTPRTAAMSAASLSQPRRFRSPLGNARRRQPSDLPDTHYGAHKVALEGLASVYPCIRPTGVYGITRVGDNHPTSPDTHYGAHKVALEGLASVYPQTTCIRPTGVYGITHPPCRSKWYDMARDVTGGRPVTTARTSTEVHGDDVAAAVWLLLTARETDVAGRAFNCSDLVVSTREVAERMYAARGVVAGSRPTLPPEMPPPDNIMRCDGLRALGWRPGGRRRLQATIRALLDAAQRLD